jgi:hypothetical protein
MVSLRCNKGGKLRAGLARILPDSPGPSCGRAGNLNVANQDVSNLVTTDIMNFHLVLKF